MQQLTVLKMPVEFKLVVSTRNNQLTLSNSMYTPAKHVDPVQALLINFVTGGQH